MKIIAKLLGVFILLLLLSFAYLYYVARMPEPQHPTLSTTDLPTQQISDSLWVCGDSWFRLNPHGLWELYVQGQPYQMGYKNGQLTQHLVRYQEEVFVEQIDELVPSRSYLQFLRLFLGWFNRDLLSYVPAEYQQEIAGISQVASPDFYFIAPPFQRIMSYHGAHDMGHALQSMTLVGCTSFGVWNQYTNDSSLIIGRNFDFYAGDKFSENKIIAFMRPAKGHPFMSVTWGGMIGVVSGINLEGLTITLNSEPSSIPTKSKLPVSLLAREILQYATTIDEAFAIAQKHETFVSESFLIGSAKENCVALIEKTIDTLTLLRPQKNYLAVTNHFINPALSQSTQLADSQFVDASHYRMHRVQNLIDSLHPFSTAYVAQLLRDRDGKQGHNIGLGNEKAINQLIAHHGIIFKPNERKVWVSAAPFQLGEFVAYDLAQIFSDSIPFAPIASENIPPDSFALSPQFQRFMQYKQGLKELQTAIKQHELLSAQQFDDWIQLNPSYFYPWKFTGDYFTQQKEYTRAISYYTHALTLEIPQLAEKLAIEDALTKCTTWLAEDK